jgi:hypothetical protein
MARVVVGQAKVLWIDDDIAFLDAVSHALVRDDISITTASVQSRLC